MTVKVSLIMPCFNEAENIPTLVKKLKEIHFDGLECIFVNNGSSDNSKEVLEKHTEDMESFRIVDVKVNEGYGNGILAGLREGKGQILGWIHADMQYEPSCILDGLKIVPEGENVWFAKGLRSKRPFGDTFFTGGMALFESLLFGRKLKDINAQPTFFSRELYNTWESPPTDFSIDLYAYLMAYQAKAKILRFPVQLFERMAGNSSWNTGMSARYKLVKRTVGYSFLLRKRLAR